jgi:hypothetical protein
LGGGDEEAVTLSLPHCAMPIGSAVISADGLYRYNLTRTWAPGPLVAFCLINPSTADAENPDPTLTRGIGFATRWGFGSLIYVNEFAYRSTDRLVLPKVTDPIGPENDHHVLAAAKACDLFIVAWGADGGLNNRDRAVLDLVRGAGVVPHCLRVTKYGYPEHLLYLPGNLKPQPYLGRPET